MAVIPLAQPRGTLDVPMSPSPQLANPMAEVGNQIGAALQDLAGGWQAASAGDSVTAFQKFQFEENKRLLDAEYALTPDKAAGFAQSWDTGFLKRAEKWRQDNLTSATPGEQRKWAGHLADLRLGHFNTASGVEQKQTSLFVGGKLSDALAVQLDAAALAANLPDDANKPLALATIRANVFAAIDASALSGAEKEARKQQASDQLDFAFGEKLPPGEKSTLDGSVAGQTVVDRILHLEGTRPNSESSAVGPGQFLAGTWLEKIKRYRPDLAVGHTDPEILALRTSPIAAQLGKEMTQAYANENSAYLQHYNIEATAGNIYLAHFLGPDGAVNMLGAGPDDIAAKINPDAAKANPTVFYHRAGPDGEVDYDSPKTAAEVAQWATELMGGTYHNDWSAQLPGLTHAQRVNLAHDGAKAFLDQTTATAAAADQAAKAYFNDAMNGAMDGTYTDTNLTKDYQSGRITDQAERHALSERIREHEADTLNLADAQGLMMAPKGTIVPQDPDHKKKINLWYKKQAGDGANLYENDGSGVAALRYVVDQASMVPDAAVHRLQAGLYSSDPNRLAGAITIMDEISRRNPPAYNAAFTEEDKKRLDIYQKLAATLPPEELAREMSTEVTPQQLAIREQLETKGRDIAEKMIRPLGSQEDDISFILRSFDTPSVGVPGEPGDGIAMEQLKTDFVNNMAVAFSRVKTVDAAKTMAMDWLRRKYGPTDIGSGDATLIAYPPERYYPSVNGSHDWEDDQLEEFVRATVPDVVDWGISPTPRTEADVAAGEPPSYWIWTNDSAANFAWLTGTADQGYTFDYFKELRGNRGPQHRFQPPPTQLNEWGFPNANGEPSLNEWGFPEANPGLPQPGHIEDGYRFNGGDPGDKKNWELQ